MSTSSSSIPMAFDSVLSTSTSPFDSTPTSEPSAYDNKTTAILVGSAIGGTIVFVIVVVLLNRWYKHRKARRLQAELDNMVFEMH
ncbi:hypothetical protein RRF57_001362 [Xylaria bambusicola]|uniref:Uncharacterized protein n=1 Tax=Xylaria bambusicola TaxID=326684 RepID=A0AAN7UHM7_9PEZI